MFAIEVDKTIRYFINVFYRVGIWSSDDESSFRKFGKKFVYIVFGALFPIFFATNSFLCSDRNESIYSVLTALEAAIQYVKLLYLLFKKDEILALVNNKIDPIENHSDYDKNNKKLKKFMRFARPYCISIYITVALLIVIKLPVFSSDKGLPFFISFTWNDSAIIYWLAFSYMLLSTPLCATVNLSTPLIWYIMLNCSIKYELLGIKLRNVGSGNKTIEPRVKKNQKNLKLTRGSTYVEDLIIFTKDHRRLAEYVFQK